MNTRRHNRTQSEAQPGLLRPGDIEPAMPSTRTRGFAPGNKAVTRRPEGVSLRPTTSEQNLPALALDSLPGRRNSGQMASAAREQDGASKAPPSPADSSTPRVLERQEIAPGLLRLRVERPAGLSFRAGQHIKFGLPGNMRSYTLVSDPDDAQLEFFIELVPGGRLSEPMSTLSEGTAVALGRAAKGSFVVDPSVANHVLVATVTGIAPFVSMLRDQARRGFPAGRFIVLHGASHAQELGYGDELGELAADHGDRFEYLATVSRPNVHLNRDWTGATGRVETLVPEVLSRRDLPANSTAVYACGNSGMIRNVRALARQQRLPFHAEAFD